MLAAIERAHRLYFRDADRIELFETMLEDVLMLTSCEYGFIGEVLHDPEGRPYLKSWAVTDIAWDEATRTLYEQSRGADGGLVFSNLDTLFGHVLSTSQVMISNDAPNDPRRGGLPTGHPPLLSFLGIPLFRNDEMIGMVGLANREGGFEMSDVTDFEPYLAVVAHMIDVIRTDRERLAAQAAEREALAAAARQERLSHIGRLASAVAHDVNSLINVISLQSELLDMDDTLPESVHTGVARIQEMCERAVQMTARLQRLRAPDADPDEQCAVGPTVASSLGFLRSVVGDGVSVALDCGIESSVSADISEGELLQVLLNLVSNAAEALAGEGRIDIVVRLDARTADGVDDVVIDVRDDGPGVPEHLREQVFIPFASTRGEGRGLGLPIVHSVLEGHGGSIELVPSTEGAVFRLRLRRTDDVAVPSA